MIRNTTLKKALKNTVFKVLTAVNSFVPKNDKIVLIYSATMGIRHSLVPIRKYLLDNHYEDKYRIYCGVESMKYAEKIPKVYFVNKWFSILIFFRAAHVFYSVGQIPIKPSKLQSVIHVNHGNADFKTVGLLTNINNGDEFFFTKMVASSEMYVPIIAKEYGCSETNVAVAGDPLTDQLLSYPRKTYNFDNFKQLLVWLPTFRQSDFLGYNDSNMDTLIPLFKEDEYESLNEMLKKHNIRMIVKLHTAQKAPEGMKRHFSHLSVFSHVEFMNSGYDLYTLIAQSDGLVGDYSSVSMQYLLLDRPQAYVIPDIAEYKKTRGFVFDNPEDYMGGHIVKNKEDFEKFLLDFAEGKDSYREKRHWVCNHVYKYKDANSCRRVVALAGMRE